MLRTRLLRRTVVAAITALTLVVVLPNSAAGGRQVGEVLWKAPTPRDGKQYKVAVGSTLSFTLVAALPPATAAPVSVPVGIAATSALPAGARLTVRPGASTTARFTWSPTSRQAGVHRIGFVASAAGLASAPLRSFTIRVVGIQQAPLSDQATETYRWAFVKRRTAVRSAPSSRARMVGTLSTVTPEYFPNLVQTLHLLRYPNGQTWVRVRLASLPNSKTGWVRRGKLGRYRTVRTRLIVSLGGLRATLYRRGRPVFRTIIGVGQSRWPTPRGDFYIREVLTGYNMPVYGPVAFGLSARSNVLTDWPGGGFIGIHGTNQPGILPGRVSHGCIRMRNAAVLRLRRLMPLGTPVQIR